MVRVGADPRAARSGRAGGAHRALTAGQTPPLAALNSCLHRHR